MKSQARLLTFDNDLQWLNWRQTGIGGSDAPIIMGISRFKRAFDLFLEKTGRRKLSKRNQAMNHGVANEAKARDAYTLETGHFMPPANLESTHKDWLHVSLDGYDPELDLILEVKVPWDISDHLYAKEGQVPEHYYPQLQHAMAVAGVSNAHYWSWWGEGDGVLIEVPFDDTYWAKELYPAEEEFWGWVTSKEYPLPKGEEQRTDEEYLKVEREVYESLAMRTIADERFRSSRAKLQRLAKAEVTTGKLLQATWTYRKSYFVPASTRSESLNIGFRRIK